MKSTDIVRMITSGYSWEQVIYEIVAQENPDPWDIDLTVVSAGFLKYLEKMEELDFRVPAKYIIIAAVLLKMKSDQIRILDIVNAEPELPLNGETETNGHGLSEIEKDLGMRISPINLPPNRLAKRRVMVQDLIDALRRAVKTEERKQVRLARAGTKIHIENVNIERRIEHLYRQIEGLMSQLKDVEITFSSLVKTWNRQEIMDKFLPLIYLDNARKVDCRQDELFGEIFIRKADAAKAKSS